MTALATVRTRGNSLVDKADGLREQIDDIKDLSLAKLQETLDDFNGALPALRS